MKNLIARALEAIANPDTPEEIRRELKRCIWEDINIQQQASGVMQRAVMTCWVRADEASRQFQKMLTGPDAAEADRKVAKARQEAIGASIALAEWQKRWAEFE